ncbi:MAG TPA: DUF6612 family protein [Patescibacteria group bacterium]|nr:DUF6612 family protein [Patescibacteria group bacterium]
MRKFLQPINWKPAVLWGLLLVVLYSPAVRAEENPADRAYLRDVYKNMAGISSVHYDVAIKGDSTMGDVQLGASGDLRDKPLKFSQELSLVYHDLLGKETQFKVQQCGEADQENLVVYMLHDGQWVKQTVPVGPVLGKVPSEAEKAATLEEMLQLIKSVKTIQETPAYKSLEITLDTMKLSDTIAATVQLQAQKTEDSLQADQIKQASALIRMALLAAGDIKYTVKVDKASKLVKETEMDLTDPIHKGAGLFLNMAPAKDREEISDFIKKATLTLKVNYSKYNQAVSIEIPQEARDTAQEVTAQEKVTLTKPADQ